MTNCVANKKYIVLSAVFFIVILSLASSAHAAPQRIVSLKPNITEIIFALGAGDRLVGVTKYCDYPEKAGKLPKVADYVKPFTERIINLSPDLIIGSKENSSRKSIHTLEKMGFKVALFPFFTVDQTLGSIRGIAKLIGVEEKGEQLAAEIKSKIFKLSKLNSADDVQRVLVVWGQRPLIVAGNGSYMDELLGLVGAENVANEGKKRYPHWSTESVIARNPDVIIDMAHSTSSGQAMDSESSGAEIWKKLDTVNAVSNKRVYTLDPSMFRPGPRLPEAMEKLHGVIYMSRGDE